MSPFTKHRLKRIAERFDLTLRRSHPIARTMGEFAQFIAKRGFSPATIIDVGVADGTIELYEPFPAATLILVEPMTEFARPIAEILKRYNGKSFFVAAAAEPGSKELHFEGGLAAAHNAAFGGAGSHVKHVECDTIDRIVSSAACNAPYLLKVDVEGFELEVIKGAPTTLLETEVVILETALYRFDGERPIFREVIDFMSDRDFEVYEILKGSTRPIDGAAALYDIAFVKRSGRFRATQIFDDLDRLPSVAERFTTRVRQLFGV